MTSSYYVICPRLGRMVDFSAWQSYVFHTFPYYGTWDYIIALLSAHTTRISDEDR